MLLAPLQELGSQHFVLTLDFLHQIRSHFVWNFHCHPTKVRRRHYLLSCRPKEKPRLVHVFRAPSQVCCNHATCDKRDSTYRLADQRSDSPESKSLPETSSSDGTSFVRPGAMTASAAAMLMTHRPQAHLSFVMWPLRMW